MDKKIIGFYKNWRLVEKNGIYYVIDIDTKEILYRGSEEISSKLFIMLAANYIQKEELL